ncbi:MAG: cyclic nucleotide-binding domain-containing protein [Dehalococcoidia bacterium]|nr:cyclic nucleotide-binding domain-containing protein [Dehalococcoidia bacterium]
MNLIQILRRCEVFVGLDDSDLEKIAGLSSCRRNTYGAGEFIFYENAEAKDFYILEDGEVSLLFTMHNEGSKELAQVPVDIITKGDVFGWSSLVTPHSLTLSALCVKPSSVVAVAGAELSQLMDSNHFLGYEVMKGLVRVIGARLRDLRRRLVAGDKLAGQRKPHRVATP